MRQFLGQCDDCLIFTDAPVHEYPTFATEVEREKISERTMRGKAERARSGKLPQGTGKGRYGCVYYPDAGRK